MPHSVFRPPECQGVGARVAASGPGLHGTCKTHKNAVPYGTQYGRSGGSTLYSTVRRAHPCRAAFT
eukprot:366151-Chlamydomonas_euryale.AAC.3